MIYRFIRALAAIFIFIIALLAFMLTPPGSKVIFAMASKFIPGEFKYAHFSGTILGPLTISQIDYQHNQTHISINRLYLTWNPVALFSKHLMIKNLVIHDMDITTFTPTLSRKQEREPNEAKTTANSLSPKQERIGMRKFLDSIQGKRLHLPVSLKIYHASFQNIRWGRVPNQWLAKIHQASAYGTLYQNLLDFHLMTDLQLPTKSSLTSNPQIFKISLNLFGNMDHYHALLTLNYADTNWLITAEGGPYSILLKTPNTKLFGGQLNGQVGLNWQKNLQWQIQVNTHQLNLKQLETDFPSKLSINLKSSGYFINDKPFFIWNLDLQTLYNKIHTEGQRTYYWQATWDINSSQLNELVPELTGKIQSKGELKGNWPDLNTQGQLLGQNIAWQKNSAVSVNSQWSIDFSMRQNSSLSLVGQEVHLFGFLFNQLNINALGTFKQHKITLTASDQNNQLNMSMIGRLINQTWQAEIEQLKFQSIWSNDWQMTKPTHLSFNSEKFEINDLCMDSGPSQICASYSRSQGNWQTAITSKINLQNLNLLPEGMKLQMPSQLKLNAAGIGSEIKQASGNLTLGKGQISLTNDQPAIPLHGGNLSFLIKPQFASLDLSFLIDGDDYIQAKLNFPNYSQNKFLQKQQPVQGEINLLFKNINFIDNLIPHLTILPGQLQGKWAVAGTLAAPQINGQLNLRQSRVLIPELNVAVDNLQLTGSFTKESFNFKATANSAGRPIQAQGTIDFSKPGFPINIKVTGTNVLVMNTKEFVVNANLDLNIKVEGFNVELTGNVVIPQATIKPVNIKGVVTLPKYDIVIIGGPQKKPTPWNLEAQVGLLLGNNVTIDVMGLKGRLIGQGSIIHHHQQTTTANGIIQIVNGHYTILGRDLTLSRNSSVIYRGNPLDNPNLNVQVFTHVTVNDTTGQELIMDNVKVGVNISGTASAPQLSFFSSPITLSPNDILSYLVLGSPGGSTSTPAASGLLLQALNFLRPSKQTTPSSTSTDLSTELKEGLGVTELGVQTETELAPLGEPTNRQTTYVVFGKQITPRLFARYKIDPMSSNNIFTLYYLLTKHIRIQSEKSNLGTGVDVLYTFETKNKKKQIKKCE